MHRARKSPHRCGLLAFDQALLPAVATGAEAEGYAGAATVIAGTVIAVGARGVVVVAAIVRPVMTVVPVAMAPIVMAVPMAMAVLRADVCRALRDSSRRFRLRRIVSGVGCGTSAQHG